MIGAALLASLTSIAQVAGDVATFKKAATAGDTKTYTTPVNSSLYALNGSGTFTLLAQSNFANASHTHTASAITDFNTAGDARWSLLAHTHVSADITDASTGGNEALDAGKVVLFGATGQLLATVAGGAALRGISGPDEGVHGTSGTGTALYGNTTGAGSIGLRLTHAGASGEFIRAWQSGQPNNQFVVDRDGAISWPNGGTGPATTRTNLGLGTLATQSGTFSGTSSGTNTGNQDITNSSDATSHTVTLSASGGSVQLIEGSGITLTTGGTGSAGTVTIAATGGGSGTVTSVAVSGSDGIEVDSGSPVTTSGTIALGVNASALKTHLSLGNVENTALSTWAGSANITTLGTITTGVWTGTDVAVADGGTGSSTASGARTNLGATTVGSNLFTLTNPSAVTYARINADNTVTARTMAQSRTDLALHPVTITAITGGSQSTTSTSLADVTGSTITFPDTGWYQWEYFIIHSSGATSTGAFFAVNTGGTMVNNYITYCITYDVLSTDKDTYCVDGYNSVIATTSSRATANNRCRMQGTIHVTTAGGMVLRFATEVNASAITVTDLSGWYRNL